jgi:hypothetical protein
VSSASATLWLQQIATFILLRQMDRKVHDRCKHGYCRGYRTPKRRILSGHELGLADTPTTLSDYESVRVYWRAFQTDVVTLCPCLDFCFVDDCFCAASLLVLEHVHVLQCRYDVVGDNVRLLSKIKDCESLLGWTCENGACEGCGPVMNVGKAAEVG